MTPPFGEVGALSYGGRARPLAGAGAGGMDLLSTRFAWLEPMAFHDTRHGVSEGPFRTVCKDIMIWIRYELLLFLRTRTSARASPHVVFFGS